MAHRDDNHPVGKLAGLLRFLPLLLKKADEEAEKLHAAGWAGVATPGGILTPEVDSELARVHGPARYVCKLADEARALACGVRLRVPTIPRGEDFEAQIDRDLEWIVTFVEGWYCGIALGRRDAPEIKRCDDRLREISDRLHAAAFKLFQHRTHWRTDDADASAAKLPKTRRGFQRLAETTTRDQPIIAAIIEGKSYRQVAAQCKVGKSTVGRVAKAYGLTGHAPETVPLAGTLQENLSVRGKVGKHRTK